MSLRVNLGSFKTFRGDLIHKQVTGRELFYLDTVF